MIMAAFDPNQKDFPSFAHRCLWCNGLMLMPPKYPLRIFMMNGGQLLPIYTDI